MEKKNAKSQEQTSNLSNFVQRQLAGKEGRELPVNIPKSGKLKEQLLRAFSRRENLTTQTIFVDMEAS